MDFEAPSASTLFDELARLSTATLLGVLGPGNEPDPAIRPLHPGVAATGRATTCRCPAGDFLAVVLALDSCQPGDALVVETDPSVEIALLGGILATFAVERGIAAVVTNGWVRDAAEIRALGFPVWARGVRLAGPTRERRGELGVPIRLGAMPVASGDLVRADDDGVVCIPAARAREVVDRAAAKEKGETAIVERIRAGASLADALGLP